jgi:hypothetical protein
LSAATRGFGGAHERGRWSGAFGPEVSLEAPPGKATRRGRREDALGSASHERVESQGCPHCAGREVVGLGPLARAFAISLQELRAHIQRADQHPDGASAQEGALARSRPGDDRGQKSGQDRPTVRRPSDDGVSLAPSVSPHTRFRQAADVERDRRSGRGSQQLFTKMLSETEQARAAQIERVFDAVIKYKREVEDELDRRESLGITGPRAHPHPDDIQVNFVTAEVRFTGPMTRRERRRRGIICMTASSRLIEKSRASPSPRKKADPRSRAVLRKQEPPMSNAFVRKLSENR